MNLHIRTFTGKTIQIEVSPSESIENIRMAIQDKEGIPAEKTVLNFGTIKLENGKGLLDYQIGSNATLDMKLT